MLVNTSEIKFKLNGCACQNGGFLVSILFLLLYFFVAREHLGRLFQPSLEVHVHLDLVSRPLLSKYRQKMDADKLLIYLQRIYCARIVFVCIRQFIFVNLLSVLIWTDVSCHHFPVKG